ncbi:MAG TPA: EAL domain-containing protein [Bordetella sp.]
MEARSQRRKISAVCIALVVLVPLLLCTLMAMSEARRQVAGQAHLVANLLQAQGESMARHEWNPDDRQDIVNLVNSVASLYACDIDASFSTGVSIHNDARSSEVLHILDLAVTRQSQDKSVTVRVMMPGEKTLTLWRASLPAFLPVAVLLMALMGYSFWYMDRQTPAHVLHRGMRRGEFYLKYQPIYDMARQCCAGAEVLMRWRPNGKAEVPPDVFIEQAEANDLIIPLTLHLFQLIERDLEKWPARPGFRLSVNIAAEHLSSPDFVGHIRAFRQRIDRHGIILTVEITERSLVADDRQACANIETVRADGVRVAIDDFGVGHCSLSYLQRFNIDSLKVDKGFVNAIESAGDEAPILDAIIDLARRLNLPALVEGVETQAQRDYLAGKGVVFVQGFLYSPPLPFDLLLAWLTGQEKMDKRDK